MAPKAMAPPRATMLVVALFVFVAMMMEGCENNSSSSSGPSLSGTADSSTSGSPNVDTSSCTASSKCKILCLHGGGQNGAAFQSTMTDLTTAWGSNFEFVFPNGPYTTARRLELWIRDPPGGKNAPTTDANFAQESVTSLNNIVNTQGPFFGILGYSQGSAYAATLIAYLPANTFSVAMLFCGYLPATHQGLIGEINANSAKYIGVKALVWMGVTDGVITNTQTEEQATKFTSPYIVRSGPGGHAVPGTSDPTFANVRGFLNH